MFNEADIRDEKRWFYEERGKTVVANVQKRNMNAQYVLSKEEALAAALAMIPEGASISRGSSVTVAQVGVLAELRKRGKYTIIDPMERDEHGAYLHNRPERLKLQRQGYSADVFVTGTNAITMDGKLVNIDSLGNRVSAMIYGPSKVIVIAGVNKIVKNVDEALERIHSNASPVITHWHSESLPELCNLPCAKTGRCTDCHHEWRICNHIVITEGVFYPIRGRINVILVGEELGI